MSRIIFKNALVPNEDYTAFRKQDIWVEQGRYVEPATVKSDDFVYDAEGCYAVANLTDFHTHVFSTGSEIGVPCDTFTLPQGITAVADAGSAGIVNMQGFLQDIQRSLTTVRVFINLAPGGITTIRYRENTDPKYWDLGRLRYFLEYYPGVIKGLKLRLDAHLTGDRGREFLAEAVRYAELLRTKLVVHIAGMNIPVETLLDILRPGDVVAHCYHRNGNGILGTDGKVLACVFAAQKRGIIFDAANGRIHWNLAVERQAISQGFYPDIVSTDVIAASAWRLPVFGLPIVMSRYVALGLPFLKVLQACTLDPWKTWGERFAGIEVGNTANLAIMQWQPHRAKIQDCTGAGIEIKDVLTNLFTLCRGQLVYRSALTL